MEILLISATSGEIAPLLERLPLNTPHIRISSLITGAGMIPTTWQLAGRLHTARPDLVIHAGIGGSFKQEYPLGSVVELTRDCFADTGAKDKDGRFLSMFELGLWQKDEFPFQGGWLPIPIISGIPETGLPRVSGITVNTVNGLQADIDAVIQAYNPDIETMEAAAVIYACLLAGIPVRSIRSVSNYVEPRNRAAWNIPLAVGRLNDFLIQYLERFSP